MLVAVRKEKRENVELLHLSLAKSLLLGSKGGRDDAPKGLETLLQAIDIDMYLRMQVQEAWDEVWGVQHMY